MNFTTFLHNEINLKRQENRNLLFKKSNIKLLLIKIEKYKIKYSDDRNIDDILQEIHSSPYLQNILSKDPLKQNICEKSQIKYIQNINNGVNLEKPYKPIYIHNGEFLNIKTRECSIKSIDAIITINDKTYYSYLKYINETGGAQDNQYNDCKLFLRECLTFTEEHFFMLIVDGPYFSTKKMNELESFQTNNILIKNSDNII